MSLVNPHKAAIDPKTTAEFLKEFPSTGELPSGFESEEIFFAIFHAWRCLGFLDKDRVKASPGRELRSLLSRLEMNFSMTGAPPSRLLSAEKAFQFQEMVWMFEFLFRTWYGNDPQLTQNHLETVVGHEEALAKKLFALCPRSSRFGVYLGHWGPYDGRTVVDCLTKKEETAFESWGGQPEYERLKQVGLLNQLMDEFPVKEPRLTLNMESGGQVFFRVSRFLLYAKDDLVEMQGLDLYSQDIESFVILNIKSRSGVLIKNRTKKSLQTKLTGWYREYLRQKLS